MTMTWNFIKDIWLLFGRLFPLPTQPGLRRVGNPDRTSPVLVTCNFELTVRKVIQQLKQDGVDAWLLVAPTKGVNVWCSAGGGSFTTDTVISIMKTSGINKLVAHRRIILPQLSASGVNIQDLKKRTGWQPRFGPVDIKYVAEYLRSGKRFAERKYRRVEFGLASRLVMGLNLGFNTLLFLILPLSLASVWFSGLWWKSIPLLFLLAVLNSVLVFWLPGKLGVRKGFSLGLLVSAVYVTVSQTIGAVNPWTNMEWLGGILLLATYLGYDLPAWAPLWRQDPRELILGIRSTHIEIIEEKCINCHICDVVCPVNVFGHNSETKTYEVVNLSACLACGGCVANCPTDAILTNFRAHTCQCPTCMVIDAAKSLSSGKERLGA